MEQERITEQGEVVKTEGESATVRIYRTSACGSCSACGLSSDKKYVDLKVANDLKANVGDMVTLSLRNVSAAKVSLVVYLIPLLAAILVLVAASLFSAPDYVCVICFVLGLAGGFFFVRLVDKRFGKAFGPDAKMIEIIKEKENESNGNK